MIQPRTDDGDDLFDVGCAGRITSFAETDDGRYMLTLTGISRFKIKQELPQQSGFRCVVPDFTDFHHDLQGCGGLNLDRTKLLVLLKDYFKAEGLSCKWDMVKSASDDTLITVLAMVCPFGTAEKQALLESIDSAARANLFMAMLEMAVLEQRDSDDSDCQCH
jgi:uncharacterized protein